MKSTTENDINAIFKRWAADVREDRSLQYKYGERRKHIENLVTAMVLENIPQDEAQMLKRRVIDILVTKEGMKGNGRHKGWKETAETDYDDAIQRAYVPALKKADADFKTSQTFKEDPNIVAWCKQKFGPNVSILTIKEVHTTGTMLRSMFVNEWHNRNTGGKL